MSPLVNVFGGVRPVDHVLTPREKLEELLGNKEDYLIGIDYSSCSLSNDCPRCPLWSRLKSRCNTGYKAAIEQLHGMIAQSVPVEHVRNQTSVHESKNGNRIFFDELTAKKIAKDETKRKDYGIF